MEEHDPTDKASFLTWVYLRWFIAVALIGGGGSIIVQGGYVGLMIGLPMLIDNSTFFAKRWADSPTRVVLLWLFLFISGLALSWAFALVACSHLRP